MRRAASILLLIVVGATGLACLFARPSRTDEAAFSGVLARSWTEGLLSEDHTQRAKSEAALRSMGGAAVPSLVRIIQMKPIPGQSALEKFLPRLPFIRFKLADTQPARAEAVRLLGDVGLTNPLASRTLVEALSDPNDRVQSAAFHGIQRMGPTALPPLIESLNSGDSASRIRAAEILGMMKLAEPTVLEALQKSAADRKPEIRAAAVQALANLATGSTNQFRLFTGLLEDPAPPVRCAAIDALMRICASQPALPSLLRGKLGDSHPVVRVEAARSLKLLNEPSSALIPVLLEAMNHADAGWKAAFALGDFGREAALAVPALITRLKAERTDRPLRTPPSSAIALGRIGAPSVPALTELLNRTNGLVRLSAVIALGYVGAEAKPAVADLIPLLKSTEPDLRQAVALSLGNIAPMTAELKPVLIDLVREDDILTSSSALALLEKIDPEGAREFEPK